MAFSAFFFSICLRPRRRPAVGPALRAAAWILAAAAAGLLGACGVGGDDAELDRLRAKNAAALAEPAWARLYFARVLERHPDDVEALRGLALASASGAEAQLTRAVEAYRQLESLGASTVEDREQLAKAYFFLGEGDRALDAIRGLETPGADGLRARIWLETEPELGVDAVRRALDASPGDAELHGLLGQLEERLGRHGAALAAAREALRLEPMRASAHYLEAQCLRRLGDVEGAAAALGRFAALRRIPSPGQPVDAGTAAAAVAVLRPLAAVDAGAWTRGAELWLRAGAVREARAWIDDGPPEKPSAEALFAVASAAQSAGQVGLARRLYGEVLDSRPDHVRAATRAARLAYTAGDLTDARRRVRTMLDQDPAAAPALHVLGLLELTAGDGPRAESHLARAVDLAPWQVAYRLTFAEVLWTDGRRDEVEALLDAAPSPSPALAAFRSTRLGAPWGVR